MLLLVGCLLVLGACTQRLICPAYQSSFIHDQEALRQRFSYFNEDSTPKILTVSKNKYLIIPEQSYRKKIRSMQTVEMKPIYPKVPDSLQMKKEDEFAGAEQDTDSLSTKKKEEVDSTYAISKDKETRVLKYDPDSLKYKIANITFNADQDNYMWYFRDLLVLPDVRAAMEGEKNVKEGKSKAGKTVKKEKKGFKGFFKNLFKKKPKNDSTKVAGPPNADVAPDSATAKPPKEKKGGFFKRKKNKTDADAPEKKKDPAKKEEDGF
jgi:hypothetical protein